MARVHFYAPDCESKWPSSSRIAAKFLQRFRQRELRTSRTRTGGSDAAAVQGLPRRLGFDSGAASLQASTMSSEWPTPWLERLRRTGVVAVVVIDDPADAEPLAETLLEGGIDLLELTLRTPSALESLRRIRRAFPSLGLGAGTILRPEQVGEVKEAGADFGVAPGLNPRVVTAAQAASLPFAPGVFSPSEIESAVELGCRLLKFFPATSDGQSRTFKTIIAPYAHLGLQFIPLGGLTLPLAESFLTVPAVAALGGSWIAPRELIRNRDWQSIRANAADISSLVQSLRSRRTQ